MAEVEASATVSVKVNGKTYQGRGTGHCAGVAITNATAEAMREVKKEIPKRPRTRRGVLADHPNVNLCHVSAK